MGYQALYRKFRPDTFEDVKGQNPIIRTLSNQIKTNQIGHAYIFSGTRGTGKTSVAKIFAKAVNCEHPVNGSPCNECAVCRSIADGTSMNVAEIDAASHSGVDYAREIVEEVKYPPTQGKYRVYIIDESHVLSPEAQNALLKTIEEPPEYVIFIFATTDVYKVKQTILSRCQRFDFRRIPLETIVDRLQEVCDKEGIEVERDALTYVARLGDGSMRDSLSLLERCVAFCSGENMTYDKVLEVFGTSVMKAFTILLRNLQKGDVGGCMRCIDEAVTLGRDLQRYIIDFTWYLRNLLLIMTGDDIRGLVDMSSEQREEMDFEAKIFSEEEIIRYIELLCELSNKASFSSQKRVVIETGLIKMCRPQMEESKEARDDRIRRLEEAVTALKKNGVAVAATDAVMEEEEDEEDFIPELEPAQIEDIKVIVANWKSMTADAPTPIASTLQVAEPRIGENGQLILYYTEAYAFDFDRIRERCTEIEGLIERKVHKKITVEALMADSKEDNKNSVNAMAYVQSLVAGAGITVKRED